MAANGSAALAELKPKMLGARLRPEVRSEANVDPKPLGERLGPAIERALLLANITKQEVSFAMGYSDQSSISKWIACKEPPRFDKLWSVVRLRASLVVALAELAGADVQTTVIVRRLA